MYTLRILIEGFPGFFEYQVKTLEQAMNHYSAITNSGYRRVNDRGELETFMPQMIKYIKITAPFGKEHTLATKYPDTFVRT